VDELNGTAAVMQRVDGEVATSSLWLGGVRIIAGELVFENFTRVEAERGADRIPTVESCK
jgi:hypothetical protein